MCLGYGNHGPMYGNKAPVLNRSDWARCTFNFFDDNSRYSSFFSWNCFIKRRLKSFSERSSSIVFWGEIFFATFSK